MYTIEVDAQRHILRLTLEGFWELDTVRAFAADEQAAVAQLACPKGEHLVLADLSRFTIQSQEVVAMCKAFIDGASNASKRLALVAGEGLARIQYKRVMGRDQMQMFETLAAAEAWLLEEPFVVVPVPVSVAPSSAYRRPVASDIAQDLNVVRLERRA